MSLGLELDVESRLVLRMPFTATAVLPYPVLGQPSTHDGGLHERESLIQGALARGIATINYCVAQYFRLL